MPKVIVGMSGGVDSAVAAYLLKMSGYEVIGVTLKIWESNDGKNSRCCEIDDAARVAAVIGIPYYARSAVSEFREYVTDPFVSDYVNGITPNPCVECNRFVKWDCMLKAADFYGAQYIATGHYASVIKLPNGRFTVTQAEAKNKDQTYMVYKLTQEQLARTLMPLGKLTKDEVRQIARAVGIEVADKPDSQEICFVTDGHYSEYIEDNYEGNVPGEGHFVDEAGNVLGTHKGITHYTVGQRKGLGIAMGHPVYVKKIDVERNEVVLSDEASIMQSEIYTRDNNFMSILGIEEGEEVIAKVKIRYHHPGEDAILTKAGEDLIKINFKNTVKAATPGQSAVFYDDEGCVIGGGRII